MRDRDRQVQQIPEKRSIRIEVNRKTDAVEAKDTREVKERTIRTAAFTKDGAGLGPASLAMVCGQAHTNSGRASLGLTGRRSFTTRLRQSHAGARRICVTKADFQNLPEYLHVRRSGISALVHSTAAVELDDESFYLTTPTEMWWA
jgi:hypothetical protein